MAKPGPRSSYRDAYCNEVIECLAKGHSVAAFAGEIGIHRTVIYDWMKIHPEFKAACEKATAKAILYWEKQLISCAETGKGNVTAIIFGLKNRAHEEWRDVHKMEHTGKDGNAIEIVTDEDRVRALAALITKVNNDTVKLN